MHFSTTTYAFSFTSLLLFFGASIAQAIHQNNSPPPTNTESQCPNGSERTMMGSGELNNLGIAHNLKRVEGASAEFADVCACPRPNRKFLCFAGQCDANAGGVCSQGGKSEAETKNENETGNAAALCKAIDLKAKLVSIAPMKEKNGKYLKCACENGSNTFSLQSSSKTDVDKGLMERHKGTLDKMITSNSLFDEFGPDIIREISWAKENGTTQCDPERQKKAIDAEKTRVAAAKEKESLAYNPPDKENKPEKKNPEDKQPKPGETTPAKEEKKPKEETKPKIDKKPTENVHGPKAPAEKKPDAAPSSDPKKPAGQPLPTEQPAQSKKPESGSQNSPPKKEEKKNPEDEKRRAAAKQKKEEEKKRVEAERKKERERKQKEEEERKRVQEQRAKEAQDAKIKEMLKNMEICDNKWAGYSFYDPKSNSCVCPYKINPRFTEYVEIGLKGTCPSRARVKLSVFGRAISNAAYRVYNGVSMPVTDYYEKIKREGKKLKDGLLPITTFGQ